MRFPEDTGVALKRVWQLVADPLDEDVVWAGTEPQALWRTLDVVEIATAVWTTGSTAADPTKTAATSHPPTSSTPTTLRTGPSGPLSSQAAESPDSPERFSDALVARCGVVHADSA